MVTLPLPSALASVSAPMPLALRAALPLAMVKLVGSISQVPLAPEAALVVRGDRAVGDDGLRGEAAVFRTTYVLGGIYDGLGATGTAEGISGTLAYPFRRTRSRRRLRVRRRR